MKALRKGFSESPDACFITGDFITDIPNETELEGLGKLLSMFASKIPTYACLGNHDGGSWSSAHGGLATSDEIKRILGKARVRLLVNERISVELREFHYKLLESETFGPRNVIHGYALFIVHKIHLVTPSF